MPARRRYTLAAPATIDTYDRVRLDKMLMDFSGHGTGQPGVRLSLRFFRGAVEVTSIMPAGLVTMTFTSAAIRTTLDSWTPATIGFEEHIIASLVTAGRLPSGGTYADDPD